MKIYLFLEFLSFSQIKSILRIKMLVNVDRDNYSSIFHNADTVFHSKSNHTQQLDSVLSSTCFIIVVCLLICYQTESIILIWSKVNSI